MPVLAGLHLDTVRLARLDFYPVLLGPKMQMAFVRVGESRITYVWRGVRWSAARTIGGRGIYLRASFPDDEADGSSLVVTFGWHEGAPNGYQIRLRFDGEGVLPVAKGAPVGDPWRGDELADIVHRAYDDDDPETWNDVPRMKYPHLWQLHAVDESCCATTPIVPTCANLVKTITRSSASGSG